MNEYLNIILTAILIAGSITVYCIPSHVCGVAANKKGLSYYKFFFLSFFFTPILGFLAVIAFPPENIIVPCNGCESYIRAGFRRCYTCGRFFNTKLPSHVKRSLKKEK